jgi:hypothetical protein
MEKAGKAVTAELSMARTEWGGGREHMRMKDCRKQYT